MISPDPLTVGQNAPPRTFVTCATEPEGTSYEYRLNMPVRSEEKMIREPSGVKTPVLASSSPVVMNLSPDPSGCISAILLPSFIE